MSVVSKERLLKKLSKKEYRDAYAEESVKTSLPFQIKAMREQRDWSQAILGRKTEMKQNAVSRLESAEYGNLSINTLLRLANAFDCGLLVKFVPFSRLLKEFDDVSPKALEVESFKDDLTNLESLVSEISYISGSSTGYSIELKDVASISAESIKYNDFFEHFYLQNTTILHPSELPAIPVTVRVGDETKLYRQSENDIQTGESFEEPEYILPIIQDHSGNSALPN